MEYVFLFMRIVALVRRTITLLSLGLRAVGCIHIPKQYPISFNEHIQFQNMQYSYVLLVI
jgi:hypothetical protein